jgi:hypothetical protein
MRRRTTGENGQGILEFAVVFPLFVFFLMAIFDVGLGLNRQATLQHAVREGARYAAVSAIPSDPVVLNRTVDQSQGLLELADITICYENINPGQIGIGDAVDVSATYQYEPFALDAVLGLFDSDLGVIDIEVTGSARLERALIDQPSGSELC